MPRRPRRPLALTAFLFVALASVAPAAGPPPGKAEAPLPPPPAGVTHLDLGDLFVKPVGPRGLALTERVKDLDGKRVRVYGYMVRREHEHPGAFLLTREPLTIIDHEGGTSDLPTDHVRVLVPGGKPAAYTPRPLLLTGALSVGNRAEEDGTVSVVRLTLDRPGPGGESTDPRP